MPLTNVVKVAYRVTGITLCLSVRFEYPCRISDITHDNTAWTQLCNPVIRAQTLKSVRGYVVASGYVQMSF